jgi:transcriptional regulator with XRE-family HTH domain
MMDLKLLGERLRMIRKHLDMNQQQLADATHLTQPAISRLEKGDEIYASTLLAVLSFYRDKICLDQLLSPKQDADMLLYTSPQEMRERLNVGLAEITRRLDQTKERVDALRNTI